MTKTTKQRVVVICPGRGTYTKESLGYLQKLHPDKKDFFTVIDNFRHEQGQTSITEIDAMQNYRMAVHTVGENAAALIYACAMADFQSIDLDKYEIVAVTGNSMGWYIALAASGALSAQGAVNLVNTMGSMMADELIGGQMIYPITDEDWRPSEKMSTDIQAALFTVNQDKQCQVYISIYLGGYLVFGGNQAGLTALASLLAPVQERFPMTLVNHAAFHTPLLTDTAKKAQTLLPLSLFSAPKIALIDGMGHIWQPYSCDRQALYRYTLGSQVTTPYHFTRAVEVAIKEYAPDKLIILGPGTTLGGAVGQTLIQQQWLGMQSKADFIALQKEKPFVFAMGEMSQRKYVT